MEKPIIRNSFGVTADIGRVAYRALLTSGLFHIAINTGAGDSRLVVAKFADDGVDRIMVALEGEGCLFLDHDSNMNQFVFIQGGFDIRSAQIVEVLFEAIALARAEVTAQIGTLPQLEHNRSE